MIQVIKHGDRIYTYKCLRCQCVFTANILDINGCGDTQYINCPECSNYIRAIDYIAYKSPLQYRLSNKTI